MNRLSGETSAYLRQHIHNPVDWYPWGEEALARALEEDRPLLVSIGYSACHWCHVMERESFEDDETAAMMNRLFVNVKVDREERPDVDQIYMDTVVRLTGQGGWPLTVFCTPTGKPFYGGTYFPPESRHGLPGFRQVLTAAHEAYSKRRDEVRGQSERIVAALAARPRGVAEGLPDEGSLRRAARTLLEQADRTRGGFGGAPKFPTPTNLELLLAACDVLPADEADDALSFVGFTCGEMARRGLYDALGGGFHRYCVDDHWGIPHFEKMLYDQGQLLRVYAETWRRSGGGPPDLEWPIRETFDYLVREMRGEEGGFFASQDADSEGVEGKFYAWTPGEIAEVLGSERGPAFCKAWGVTEAGNFERGSSALWDLERESRREWAEEREKLFIARARRVPPATDRKRVASWNGLAISGLAHAGSLLCWTELVEEAAAVADFVFERMRDDGGHLLRVFNEGRAHTSAFLDDHAALLSGLLDLHRAGAGARFLERALHLADVICERFFDEDEGDLFLTPSDGEQLVHRPRSEQDGATPNSTGLACLGLLRASSISGRERLRRVVERVVRTHAFVLERAAPAYPTPLRAAVWLERGLSAAVVVGDPDESATRALASRARQVLAPEEIVIVAAPGAPSPEGIDPSWLQGREPADGRATAWVCRGVTCSLPVHDPASLSPLNEEATP